MSRVFDLIVRALFVILPFHVLLSVFVEYKLGVPSAGIYKEVLLVGLTGMLGFAYATKKLKWEFDRLDILCGLYVLVLVAVTLANKLPFSNLFYGGRYDFEFLLAFFLIRKGFPLLDKPISYYLKLFLISGSAALAIGILVRFVFGEAILLHFGFSGNLSNWMFGGSIPIYHGIDGANVRRFQGIFDGPNPAAYFIIVYLGVLAYYFRENKKYHYILSLWGLLLIGVIFFTYSRSALIGLFIGIFALIALSIRVILKKHAKKVLIAVPLLFVFLGLFALKFESTIDRIILREDSTKGHFDRAIIGLERAKVKPLGSGLATSGPAYRYVHHPETDESLFEGDNKKMEDYYIPESWYIQQMVEGGIIGFAIFLAIMGLILVGLAQKNIFLFASFIAASVMNLFLHSFESTYISLLFFMIIGLILAPHVTRKNGSPR